MLNIVRETWTSFRDRDGRLLSGAVAFYVVLAMAPLGLIAVIIAEVVLGPEAARGELSVQLSAIIGQELSDFITESVARTRNTGQTRLAQLVIASVVGYVSVRLFVMLRRALNHLWGVRSHTRPSLSEKGRPVLKRRMTAAVMVAVFASALLALVAIRSGINAAAQWGLAIPTALAPLVSFLPFLLVMSTLIALVLRYLPDAEVHWRDAIVGAFLTSVFVALGSFVIADYLGYTSPASAYGAAGSFVALLLWIYYTTQIMFLGASFTRAWARHHRRDITPLPHASRVVAAERISIL